MIMRRLLIALVASLFWSGNVLAAFISNASNVAHLGMGMSGTTSDFTVMWRYELNALPSTLSIAAIATNAGLTDYVVFYVDTDGTTAIQSILGGVSQQIAGGPLLSTGVNYHFAIVHDQGVNTVLYMNGVVVATLSAGITYTMDEFALGVGGVSPDITWKANYPRTWQRTLNSSEVAAEVTNISTPNTLTSIWDWWILNTDASFTNGQINGSGRQVAQQNDTTYFTADTNDLAPTVAALSAPTPSGTLGTSTTATLGVTTNQTNGTFYSVVDTGSNLSGVTAAQIKAGQKASGAAALKSCNAAISTTTPSCGVTGLTASTAYVYASIQNNSAGDSNIATGSFTTGSAAVTVPKFIHHLEQQTVQ